MKAWLKQAHDRHLTVRFHKDAQHDKFMGMLHAHLGEHLQAADDSTMGCRFMFIHDVGVGEDGQPYTEVTVVDRHPGTLDKRPLLQRAHRALRRKALAAGVQIQTPDPPDPDAILKENT